MIFLIFTIIAINLMIIFKRTSIHVPSEDTEQILSNIKSKISRTSFLWATNTAHWVIFPDRLFAGKEHKDGRVTMVRYRHKIFKLLPKIQTTWKLQKANKGHILEVSHRIDPITLFFLLYPTLTIIKLVLLSSASVLDQILIMVLLLGSAILLMFRSSRTTESILTKLAMEKKDPTPITSYMI